MLYHIEVKHQGSYVASHIIEAPDALTAINLLESQYSGSVGVETSSVEDERGRGEQIEVVRNWLGYTFEARAVSPQSGTMTNQQMECAPA
jgi:hypothetical protein